jgi:polygalacturonase
MNRLIKKYALLSAVSAITLLYGSNIQAASKDCNIDPTIYNGVPFKMSPVVQPSFPDKIVNIIDFGAKGDGITMNTKAINDAIKNINANGGGTVVIPSGLWLTGPIELLDNVNLYTEKNALVLFTDDYNAYSIINTSFEGMNTRRCQSPISARNATNIAITGSGVFDGSGDAWRPVKKDKLTESQWKNLVNSGGVLSADKKIWYPTAKSIKGALATENFNNPTGITTDADWESIKEWLRPVMVSIVKCNKVLLQGVTFKNSPSWCLHPLSCENITINNVNVSNPWYSQNGDALDMESCKNALIINSTFDAGDDAICLKSGKDEDGRKRGEPCENVIVKNNIVLHGHGGFVVGSEMSGGVKNIFVSNCSFVGTDVGLRFKSTRGRGGVVEGIYIEHINMINIPNEPLLFDLFYGGKAPDEVTEEDKKDKLSEAVPPVTEETPTFKDIHISDIYCKKAGRAMFFNGLPEMRIQDVTVKNVVIADAKEGAVINQASGVVMDNIKISSPSGNSLSIKNANNIKIDGILFKVVNDNSKTVIFK